MGTVHFTLGQDAGKLLMEIAQEHLTHSLDPEKAIKTITESLIGCPYTLALELLKGTSVITVSEDGRYFNVEKRTDEHKKYPSIDIIDWVQRSHDRIGEDGDSIFRMLGDIMNMIADRPDEGYTVDFKTLLQYVQADAEDKEEARDLLYNDFIHSDIYDRFTRAIAISRNYMVKTYKTWQVIEFFTKNYPKEFDIWNHEWIDKNGDKNVNDEDGYKNMFKPTKRTILSTAKHEIVSLIASRLSVLMSNNYDMIKYAADKENEMLNNYINGQLEIEKTIERGIKPVNMLDNYSAGWLSQTGEFYGLNGEISNMLHNQLADAMLEAGIIPQDEEYKGNPDRWLGDNGWAKIHGDWILYEGYDNIPGRKKTPMSDIQVRKIYEYGQICCNGMLRIGYQERMSAARFNRIEKTNFYKLFSV